MLLSLQESVFSRAQTLENWWSRQAPLRMVETLADASKFPAQDMDDDDKSKSSAQDMDDDDKSKSPAQDMDDDDVEDFSPIRGDESPPHLRAKNAFFASLSRQSVQEGLPAVCTSDPASSSASFDVRQFLVDEEKEIQEIIAASVPVFSERQCGYKFGGCPKHLTLSLQPHVPKSGCQRGQLLLRCSNFWKRGSDDKPLCWFQFPFPMKLWSHLPKPIQEQFVDLENSLQRNAVKT